MMRLTSLALLLAAVTANAQETPRHPLLNDTFRVSLGGLYGDSTTEARLGSSAGGTGVAINFEDTLGLPEKKWVGEAMMYWRFADRWRLDLDYFRLARNGSRTLSADATWGDNTFTAGTVVNSSFQLSDLRAALGYSFFRRQDKEVGIGVGLHSTSFKASIDAAGIGGRSESATAPLPFLALYGAFALTDTWALSMRADWLSLSYDKYSGGIRSTAFDVVYQPFKHVAFGIGMHSLNLHLDVDNPHAKFQTRVGLEGPAAFMSVSF